MTYKLITVVFLTLSVLFSTPAGTITSVAGQAFTQKPGGKLIPARKNAPVSENTSIITRSGSKVIIKMASGADITVGPNTRMKIQKNSVQNRQGASTSISLSKGSLSAKISKLTKSDSFKIHTPTSVAGVRGTDFSVATGMDGSSVVAVSDGKVNVATDSGDVNVNPNQKAEGIIGSSSAPAADSGEEDISKWLEEREEVVAKDPVKAVDNLQAQLEKIKKEAVTLSESSENQAKQDVGSDQDAILNSEKSGLMLNDNLNHSSAANDSILANAMDISRIYKNNKKVAEKLNGIQRIHKMVDEYNKRISAALARLDGKLAEAYKRIDDSWKKSEDKLNKRFDSFDKDFKDFDVK